MLAKSNNAKKNASTIGKRLNVSRKAKVERQRGKDGSFEVQLLLRP